MLCSVSRACSPFPIPTHPPTPTLPTPSEWLTNQHRDTYATHLGHHDQLAYIAVAQNDAVGRVRYQLLEKMLQPCGPPPAAKDDEEEE